MTKIYFAAPGDAAELVEALAAGGYSCEPLRAVHSEDGAHEPTWVLVVAPSDERVIDMVDVYGGWLSGDEQWPGV